MVLKTFDAKKENVIRQLAKDVEARGVPKSKVARQVVRELVARDAASPHYIYECLGIEGRKKTRKKDLEESTTVATKISAEQSSALPLQVSVKGREETYQSKSDSESEWITVKKLESELSDTQQELRNAIKEISRLREHQDVGYIPRGVIVDDRIGLVRKDHLSTLTES